MKNKKRLLAVGVFALILLTAVYFIVSQASDDDPEQSPPGSFVKIIDRDRLDVAELSLKSPGFSIVLVQTENDVWAEQGKDYAMNETNCITLAMNFSQTNAEVLLENAALSGQSLTDYGFGAEEAVVSAKYKDGAVITMRVGKRTPDGQGYYAMLDNNPALYIITETAGYKYYYTYEELLGKRVAEISYETLRYIYFKLRGQEPVIADASLVPSEDLERFATYGVNTLMMTSPIRDKLIYVEVFDNYVVLPAQTIRLGAIADMYPTDLSVYGLDDPEVDMVLIDADSEYALTIGAYTDESKLWRYCLYGSYDQVFTVSADSVTPLFQVNALNFVLRIITLVNIYDVDRIVIETNESAYDIYINSTVIENDDGTGVYEIAPVVNMRRVPDQEFRQFYTYLVGLSYDAVLKDESFDKTWAKYLTVTYYMNNGEPDITDSYYIYDSNYFLIEKDGILENLISRVFITEMLDALRALID